MHMVVGEAARADCASVRYQWWAATGTVVTVGQGLAGLGFTLGAVQVGALLSVGSFIGSVGVHLYGQRAVEALSEEILSEEGMDRRFRKEHVFELAKHDEFTLALWGRVRPQLQVALQTIGLSNYPVRAGVGGGR